MFAVLYFTLQIIYLAHGNMNGTTTWHLGHPLSLRNLCPYNNFCYSAPEKEILDESYEPCCEVCSCESDCFETGSCCPDMPLSGLVDPKYPCRHLWHFGKNVNMIDGDIDRHWYHVIDDCPDQDTSTAFQRCKKPTEIEDYVIVTDTKTGKVYRNKHCAECNNILSYAKLDLVVKCLGIDPLSMTNFATKQERKIFVMEYCSLSSVPPDNRIGLSHCVPESDVILKCNTTGTWDIYDTEIEKGCMVNSRSQNKIFKSFSDRGIHYFANVYCYLCNGNSNVLKADICEIQKYNEVYKSGIISIYHILDFDSNAWEEDTTLTEIKACLPTHIWDPFSMICRQLFCPAGQIPYYGRCKGLFRNIEGYAIAVHFDIRVRNGSITASDFLLRVLTNRVLRELGSDITCGICRSTIFAGNNSTSQMFLRFEIFADKKCPYNTLLERTRKVAIQKNINLQFGSIMQYIRMVLTFIFEDVDRSSGFIVLVEKNFAFCSVVIRIDETILLHCPAIMMSSQEINELGLKNSYVGKGSNAADQKVCVDSLLSAHRLNKGVTLQHCVMVNIVHIIVFIAFVI